MDGEVFEEPLGIVRTFLTNQNKVMRSYALLKDSIPLKDSINKSTNLGKLFEGTTHRQDI